MPNTDIIRERKKIRTKIANTVRRNNIEKKCFKCGKDGKILYDFNNPYNVVFICNECKKDNDTLKEAENHRIDIQELIRNSLNEKIGEVNLINKQIRWLNIDTITDIIDKFLVSDMTLGEYCRSINTSRYQFNNMVNVYRKAYPKSNIKNKLKLKMNKVQKDRVIELKRKIK